MNTNELKIKLQHRKEFLATTIKELKKDRSGHYKSGHKYQHQYGHHLKSENKGGHYLATLGIKHEGVAGYADGKLHKYAFEYRSLTIALAFLQRKRFDKIERFWYNLSVPTLLKKKYVTYTDAGLSYYSIYGERYGRQEHAINQAKFLLGMFRYEPVQSKYSKRFSHNKIVYENDEEFNEWIKVTSNHFFNEDVSPISLTYENKLNRDSLAGKDLHPIVQWTKEKNAGSESP
jgi:hypothetical protein